MTSSKNKVELKTELKAKTDELVSKDKELFANLSKEEITEKKQKRAKAFREENRDLLDDYKIASLEKKIEEFDNKTNLMDKDREMKKEIRKVMIPFIEKNIDEGTLSVVDYGGDGHLHGHLPLLNGKYGGHYIYAELGGLFVDVYRTDEGEIFGDPLDFPRSKGNSRRIYIPLKKEYRDKLIKLIENKITEEENSESAGTYNSNEYIAEMADVINILLLEPHKQLV